MSADVRLNNYSVDPTKQAVRKQIAFVPQDDSLQITATPREAIRFSAKMRLSAKTSETELDALTSVMLSELGLKDCKDTIIGGALVKGISGGERKRTAVGVELVTKPALVFLDGELMHATIAVVGITVCRREEWFVKLHGETRYVHSILSLLSHFTSRKFTRTHIGTRCVQCGATYQSIEEGCGGRVECTDDNSSTIIRSIQCISSCYLAEQG